MLRLQADVSPPISRKSQQGPQGPCCACRMQGPFSRVEGVVTVNTDSHVFLQQPLLVSVTIAIPILQMGEILAQKVEVIFPSFPRLES